MRLSDDLQISLSLAMSEAGRLGHEYAGLEHLLYALTFDDEASEVLRHAGADVRRVQQRLADYLAEVTGLRLSYETVRVALKAGGIVLSRPQHTVTSPDPEYQVKRRRSSRPVTTSQRATPSTMPMSST